MIFLLNTSFDPHWCALFDEKGTLLASRVWEDRKTGVACVTSFVEEHRALFEDLRWCGGVSGPGGFSSLRAASVLLNTLAWKYSIPVVSATAFEIGRHYLGAGSFVLNSFGQSLFVCHEGLEYQRVSSDILDSFDGFDGFLPLTKRRSDHVLEIERLMAASFSVLFEKEKALEKSFFVPEYFFDAIN